MKKISFFIVFIIILNSIWCEDVLLEKIMSINNGNDDNELLVRNHLDEDDDITGNVMKISPKGKIFIHCRDKHTLYLTDIVQKNIVPSYYSTFLPHETYANFSNITENNFLFAGYSGRIYLIDNNNELKIQTEILNKMDLCVRYAYYDEECNILFFLDPYRNLHSIVNPSLDDSKNKKNYKDSLETKNMILNGNYGKKFSYVNNEFKLTINGKLYLWETAIELKNIIYVINTAQSYLNIYNGKTNKHLLFTIQKEDVLESYTWHPCGDAYFLTMNWSTQTHTLWYIENTWDPEFREQWYKDHPDAMQP